MEKMVNVENIYELKLTNTTIKQDVAPNKI